MDIEVAPERGPAVRRPGRATRCGASRGPGNSANQAPTAVAQADATTGNRPADGQLRRDRLERPGRRRRAHLRVGPRRRRRARRLDRRRPDVHLHCRRGTYTVTLRVTDTSGASDTDTLTITVGERPGRRRSTRPAAGTTWGAATAIAFSGIGDGRRGRRARRASALDWAVVLRPLRAPGNCHEHQIGDFPDTAGGLVHRARPRRARPTSRSG